jgi:hypothetical protein
MVSDKLNEQGITKLMALVPKIKIIMDPVRQTRHFSMLYTIANLLPCAQENVQTNTKHKYTALVKYGFYLSFPPLVCTVSYAFCQGIGRVKRT